MNLKKQSVILGLLPLFHGYGYGLLMVSVIVGNQIVLLPKFEEKLFLSTVQTYKVSNVTNIWRDIISFDNTNMQG